MGTLTVIQSLVTETCCVCGTPFAMERGLNDWLRRHPRRESFYCPKGHQQHYLAKSDAEKLAEAEARLIHERDQARARENRLRQDREAVERSNAALRGVVTRTKKRIGNGVCPCCNRTFKDLARHMGTQHPTYSEAE